MSTPENSSDQLPVNTQETGSTEPVKKGKKLLKSGRDPIEVGKATQIKKGERRNPSGRPKKKLIASAYEHIGRCEVPKEMLVKLGINRKKLTFAELAAMGMYRKFAEGNVEVAREVRLAVDGPDEELQPQLAGPQLEFGRLSLEDGSAREQLTVVTARFRERIAKRREALTIDADSGTAER